jgi:hypothetical protein
MWSPDIYQACENISKEIALSAFGLGSAEMLVSTKQIS